MIEDRIVERLQAELRVINNQYTAILMLLCYKNSEESAELLEALKALEEFHATAGTQSDDIGRRAVHAKARAAIAKAEGGAE